MLNNSLRYTDPSGHCIPGQPGCQEDNVPNVPNPYGINFTTGAGTTWDVRDQNQVLDAARAIAMSLRQSLLADRQANRAAYRQYGEMLAPVGSAAEVFHQVYGPVTFHRSANQCPDPQGCWARTDTTPGGEVVTVYTSNNINFGITGGQYTYQNAAHELGHAFAHRADRQPYDDLTAEWNANPNFPQRANNPHGFAGGFPGWQQSQGRTANEEFADMFLGWAYNRWGNNVAGRTRSQWMTTHMPGWIALAVNQ